MQPFTQHRVQPSTKEWRVSYSLAKPSLGAAALSFNPLARPGSFFALFIRQDLEEGFSWIDIINRKVLTASPPSAAGRGAINRVWSLVQD